MRKGKRKMLHTGITSRPAFTAKPIIEDTDKKLTKDEKLKLQNKIEGMGTNKDIIKLTIKMDSEGGGDSVYDGDPLYYQNTKIIAFWGGKLLEQESHSGTCFFKNRIKMPFKYYEGLLNDFASTNSNTSVGSKKRH
jgi:hypothetical protein